MRTHTKPIIALASGAVLLSGLLCQTAHAQSVVLGQSYPVTLADLNGSGTASGPNALPVTFVVTDVPADAPTPYLYSYTINNTSSGAGSWAVESFSVNFVSTGANVVADVNAAGGQNGGQGVEWSSIFIAPSSSETLTFESDDAPVLGNANAGGAPNGPAPWASSPNGSQVAVPSTVPEPEVASLLGLALLLAPFRFALFRKA